MFWKRSLSWLLALTMLVSAAPMAFAMEDNLPSDGDGVWQEDGYLPPEEGYDYGYDYGYDGGGYDEPALYEQTQADADMQAYLASLGPVSITPANADCSPEEPEKTEANSADAEFVPGVVLFSLKEGVTPELLDLAALGLSDWEPILSGAESVESESGAAVWYRASCAGDEAAAVAALRETGGVADAELDYIYHSDSYGVPQEVEVGKSWVINELLKRTNEFWWSTELSEKINPGAGTVVAVIDTGVDYTHEDLAANMWVNSREIPGNGIDDDGNGYIDDVYGVNVTASGAQAGDPMDDNGHGTHVAGIIGMSSNGKGGVGLAWGAKIMAVKAGQSTGTFTSSDIAKAINYANAMGADVINMSFGGTEKSYLVEQALAMAFPNCVLVASAGNNGIPTTDAPPEYIRKADIYPAGYSYVLGVMATDQTGDHLASFSNWDYKKNANCEYELTAPGVSIFSTLPGDRYATWSGTSMSAPCVAAAAAILRSHYSDKDVYSSRFIMGQLASATDRTTSFEDRLGILHTYAKLDIYQSCTRQPEPNISFQEVFALDNKRDDNVINDGDGIMDAGEIIDLGFAVRNQWGQTGEITVTADAISDAGVANPYVKFNRPSVTLASAGTFATTDNGYVRDDGYLTSVTNPITFTLAPGTPNDAEIRIRLTATTTNGVDPKDGKTYTAVYYYTFTVQNGRAIGGKLDGNMTLTNDYYWIIENALYIPEGVTLTVKPGTQIQFWSSDYEDAYGGKSMAAIVNDGTLNMIGTEEQPISCFPGRGFSNYMVEISGRGVETLRYCDIINPRLGYTQDTVEYPVDVVDHCRLTQDQQCQYIRKLYGSTVQEDLFSYSTSSFSVGQLSNSTVSGFRAESGQRIVRLDSGSGNCFNDCSIDLISGRLHPAYSGTVFLRGNGGSDAGSYGTDLTGATAVPVYRCAAMIDSAPIRCYEGRYYVFLSIGDRGEPDAVIRYELAKAMAEACGGTLLCLGSAGEEDFVYDFMHEVAEAGRDEKNENVGLIYSVWTGYRYRPESDDYAWDDGGSYSPKEKLERSNGDGYAYLWINSSLSSGWWKQFRSYSSPRSDTVGLEIPANTATGEALTEDDVRAALKSFDTNAWLFDYYAPAMTNCAILNPVLNNDPETWARFTAPSYRNNYRCYNLTGNYWGTENAMLINKMIVDADDFAGTLGDIVEQPILTRNNDLSSIYPFVTDVRVTDKDGNTVTGVSVGGEYTVTVTFNRDMDQTVQPSVTYGPAAPYTDFVVNGDWVSPREWVGTTVISPVMTAGTQYFKTTGGRAADDHWLVCGNDILRFAMNVSTTGAAAMLLQARGGANKVELSWAQNDYATLAGYNIYRSTSRDGKYTKINGAIVNDTAYTDIDVQPGVTYYYYFTVVNTEGNEESSKSNIAEGRPLDNVMPVLQHTPVTAAHSGKAVVISAKATDNIAVESVTLYYRASNETAYRAVEMVRNASQNGYTATIPASAVTTAGVAYYIVALDGDRNAAYSGTAEIPNHISVDDTPFISGLVPAKVSISGGATVTMVGGCFTEGMTLKVGTQETAYTLVDDGQLTFTAPAMPAGSCDVTLSRNGRELARATLYYTDEESIAQIPTRMEMVSGIAYDIPLYFTVNGGMTSFHAELDLGGMGVQAVTVEPTETFEQFSIQFNRVGNTLKIGGISTESVTVNGREPLVTVRVTPAAVSSDQQYEFTLHDVQCNGADVAQTISGTAVVKPNYSLTVNVQYYKDARPVSGAEVKAGGISGVTDSTGSITLTGIPTNSVTAIIELLQGDQDAVTANDASLVLQASVAKIELDAHQKLAADVNGDGKVNEADAALILQMAVRKITAFPGGKVWVFDPQLKELTLHDGSNTVQFTGILLGDVDGSWKRG